MSWSYSYKGDALSCLDDVNAKFSAMNINPEPEKTIKSQVQAIVTNALTNWNPKHGIEITAWGSQSTADNHQTNDLSVRIGVHKLPDTSASPSTESKSG